MTNPGPWWQTWPVEEVAATILPLFAQPECSPCVYDRKALGLIVAWCKRGVWGNVDSVPSFKTPFESPDYRAVSEALQVLEGTRLLLRGHISDTSLLGLTRLGMHALQTNTVRQHLGLSETPPMDSN
jgi:hypothetical protein